MPSRVEYMDYEQSGSEDDPDYYPSDTDDDYFSSDEAYNTDDRCRYIQRYRSELESLWLDLLQRGVDMMGPAFLQTANLDNFSNFCYKHTQPREEFPIPQ